MAVGTAVGTCPGMGTANTGYDSVPEAGGGGGVRNGRYRHTCELRYERGKLANFEGRIRILVLAMKRKQWEISI